MIDIARRFKEIMTDLLFRREVDSVTQEEESDAAAELERHWNEMTESEQSETEQMFMIQRIPGAPACLDLVDNVESQEFPRRLIQ